MVSITINGNKVDVPNDYTVLKACRQEGIDIPTFCEDERLRPSGACRMCLVEVAGSGKIVTSCSEKVWEGMEVRTNSKRVMDARKQVLKLIVMDHPLDCLTCEKSGECKLQDYCYEYEVGSKLKGKTERRLPIDDSNPFYYFDPDKCIKCGKCVRICSELQCSDAILMEQRGLDTKVSTPFGENLENSPCVSCGNCVSYCPVGALMPKSKTRYRAWETKKVRTTCAYCGVGCQIDITVKGDRIVEAKPAIGKANEGLLCVKGKFAYGFVNHPDRLKTPLVRKDGKLVETSWEEAYSIIASKITDIKAKHGAGAFAGLTSARCTNEENYLFQKLFRGVIGTNNVDHCARL
ncbi:4Fe-4S dicluster domain-containing protein [Peptoclostridium litorale DSM 5388]|nr:NADH-quinone oxidoreductase subunit G 2 [Peptoclostridium litorale DSM 5388]SIN94344.1 4Fe-4S dicluster domain-containing protein [Peptoclostridium litorale DSM 5388]